MKRKRESEILSLLGRRSWRYWEGPPGVTGSSEMYPVVAAMSLWWFTRRRPLDRQLGVAGLVALFVIRLRWRRLLTQMDAMMDLGDDAL